MTYRVEIKRQAIKQLNKIASIYQGPILAAIKGLENNPRSNGDGKMSGVADQYKLRVGKYRIIYTINDDVLFVEVIKIGHRSHVYNDNK
jgi:mRNA interferase RelE/StbE